MRNPRSEVKTPDPIMTSKPVKPSSLRLLILSPRSPTSNTSQTTPPSFRPFLEALTGSKPADEITTFAGYTSHPPLRLRTKYYERDVSIWCDEIPGPSLSVQSDTQDAEQGSVINDLGRNRQSKDERDDDVGTTVPTTAETGQGVSPGPSLSEWKSQMTSSDSEAAEVRSVIAGIILLLSLPSIPPSSDPTLLPPSFHSLLETVHALREAIEDESPGRDVASLVIFQANSASVTKTTGNNLAEQAEELALAEGWFGWDFVALEAQKVKKDAADLDGQIRETLVEEHDGPDDEDDSRNEFNEKKGLARVIEVLEAVDWSASPDYGGQDDGEDGKGLNYEYLDTDVDLDAAMLANTRGFLGGDDDDLSNPGFDMAYQLQREMMELKMSMLDPESDDEAAQEGADEQTPEKDNQEQDHQDKVKPGPTEKREKADRESQIVEFPALVERVVAIREAGAEMSKAERERFARREVARIMREMG
jgi:hypothetical protein